MRRTSKAQSGFSIIELMIAVFILAFGVLACMGMLLTGMATNTSNKNDSAGTMLAQMVIEQIYTLPPDSGQVVLGQTMNVTDCAGNTFTIKTASGGSTNIWAGANIDSTTGGIDYTQAASNITSGYQMSYTTCASQTGESAVYDVRWAVGYLSQNTNMVVVSARQSTAANLKGVIAFRPPVTLRTIQGP